MFKMNCFHFRYKTNGAKTTAKCFRTIWLVDDTRYVDSLLIRLKDPG